MIKTLDQHRHSCVTNGGIWKRTSNYKILCENRVNQSGFFKLHFQKLDQLICQEIHY